MSDKDLVIEFLRAEQSAGLESVHLSFVGQPDETIYSEIVDMFTAPVVIDYTLF